MSEWKPKWGYTNIGIYHMQLFFKAATKKQIISGSGRIENFPSANLKKILWM